MGGVELGLGALGIERLGDRRWVVGSHGDGGAASVVGGQRATGGASGWTWRGGEVKVEEGARTGGRAVWGGGARSTNVRITRFPCHVTDLAIGGSYQNKSSTISQLRDTTSIFWGLLR
jgi:hypothetical protein